MKANELRIGNYLERNGLMEVKAISPMRIKVYDHINKMVNQYRFFISTFKPIPLTEEWLLKLGFAEDPLEEIIIYRKNGCVISSNAKTHHSFIYKGLFIKFILYVHQLQNLYFALTGGELIIKI